MDQKNRRRYEALARVRDFGAAYGYLFPDFSLAADAFAVVARCVQEIETHDLTSATASVSAGAAAKDSARAALVSRLRLIGRTANVVPGVDTRLKSHCARPRPGNDLALLTAARECRQRIAPLAAAFVGHGMRPTFLADFDALIDQFDAALRDRGMGRARVVAARAGIRAVLATGLAAMRQIDVIVANHFGGESVVSHVWQQSQRIGFTHASRKGPDAVADPLAPKTRSAEPSVAAVVTDRETSATAGSPGTLNVGLPRNVPAIIHEFTNHAAHQARPSITQSCASKGSTAAGSCRAFDVVRPLPAADSTTGH